MVDRVKGTTEVCEKEPGRRVGIAMMLKRLEQVVASVVPLTCRL